MSETNLAQRQSWYRYFPEGSLEFLVATRVLVIILLIAFIVMHDLQRPIIVTAIIAVLWFDYVLVLWWAIQVRLDLDLLAGRAESNTKRWVLGIKTFLPSVVVAYSLAAYMMPGLAGLGRPSSSSHQQLVFIVYGVAAVLFVILAVLAYRALMRIQLGKSIWIALLFVPGLHWFAIHRVAGELGRHIDELRKQQSGSEVSSSVSMALADVTWALTLLPWLAVIGIATVRGTGGGSVFIFPFCGMLLGALFAIADLAALERVQRHFVHLTRES